MIELRELSVWVDDVWRMTIKNQLIVESHWRYRDSPLWWGVSPAPRTWDYETHERMMAFIKKGRWK